MPVTQSFWSVPQREGTTLLDVHVLLVRSLLSQGTDAGLPDVPRRLHL